MVTRIETPKETNWVADTTARLSAFRDARGWQGLHTPRNLATAVSIEVAELLEIFQWRADRDIEQNLLRLRPEVADELADITIYLIHLADAMGIELDRAVDDKIRRNAMRFPSEPELETA